MLTVIILICIHLKAKVSANPIAFDPTAAPLIAYQPMPIQPPMIMSPHYDPYATMQAPAQFIFTSPFGPLPFDSTRRSLPGLFKASDKSSNKQKPQDATDNEEQKALGDLPVSFVSKII